MAGGWWFPDNSRKAHYWIDEKTVSSLCGRWGKLNNAPLEDSNHHSSDNCKECMRKRDALEEKETA